MIYLIRHTRPDVAAGICYGQSDVPLAESFDDELARLGEKLIFPANAVVMSSPLQRCLQLATSIFDESQILVDDRLLEMYFGDWEMQAWDDLDPIELADWGNNFVYTSSPNGESLEYMSRRVMEFWNSLDHLHQDYVLFTHSGVIRVVLAHLLESPLGKAFTLEVRYGDVVKVRFIDDDNCTIRFN